MNSKINKKILQKIIDLAKLNIDRTEYDKILEDFGNIVQEVERIQGLSDNFVIGNTIFQQVNNQFSQGKKMEFDRDKIINSFPKSEKNMGLVPPIKGDSK
jgi:aspartyl/glutamyl-tRNA(Asn/Gln) amidotransferase C subunit